MSECNGKLVDLFQQNSLIISDRIIENHLLEFRNVKLGIQTTQKGEAKSLHTIVN